MGYGIVSKIDLNIYAGSAEIQMEKLELLFKLQKSSAKEEIMLNVDGVRADKGQQLTLVRLALDDAVILHLPLLKLKCRVPIIMDFHSNS